MVSEVTAKKEKAIEFMKKFGIYSTYIKKFSERGSVCLFEDFGGYFIDSGSEIASKIKEIESKHNCVVYAVTHEYTEFGEIYDFLIVTDYSEEWNNLLCKDGNTHYAFAYVWNKDDEWCSEFGDIGVRSFGGGIKRVA